ncbi:MAG: hypothetical protein HYX35_05130 [Proteobacteria bacterium]|nr:hypothetical protein [Pseudomonadota bacterium]
MRRLYYILLPLLLAACSSFSDSEVIMRASPETRASKPHMPPIEKPFQAPHDEANPIPISPQIGVRVPLGN